MNEQEKKDNANYAKHFTRTQNILYDSYKYLTKEEKWLHSCLRRLFCEDTKPRYYSLRELASLTDYSVGALSKMLPRLHKVGLIHSEIKRKRTKDGKETGNALYHITIIDIWELNKDFYSCSPNERVDPSEVLVHEIAQASSRKVTSPLTKSDKPASSGEQDRAQNNPQKRTLRSNKKKNTEEENAHVSDDNAPTFSSSNSQTSLEEVIPSQTPAEEQRDTTQPLTAENGTTEPALPEFASQAQGEATGQGNEQSSDSKQVVSHSQSQGKKTTSKPAVSEKPAKPAKVELTTEFANDDERSMWERLDNKERAFYKRMNTQERATYAQWCSLFKAHQTLGEAMFNACRKIAPANPVSEAMKDARKWLFDTDNKTEKYPKGFYHTVGVQFWHLAEKWPAWESLQEQAETQKQTSSNGQKSALAQESGITRPELYRPAEDNNPLREASLSRQWIDPKKRNRRVFGNEAS